MKSSAYTDYVTELLAPLGVSARAMFGGFGLYRNGIMVALIADDRLYFKVGDANRTDYENAASEPFIYESKGKQVTMSYREVPAEMLDDGDALCRWAEKAYNVAITGKKAKGA